LPYSTKELGSVPELTAMLAEQRIKLSRTTHSRPVVFIEFLPAAFFYMIGHTVSYQTKLLALRSVASRFLSW
jgi:hypothetical protein